MGRFSALLAGFDCYCWTLAVATDKEKKECWDLVKNGKYGTIFDGHIGTMRKRAKIQFKVKEGVKIVSQPYRSIPPQFRKEVSDHLGFLRQNNKIKDVKPNEERVEAPPLLCAPAVSVTL